MAKKKTQPKQSLLPNSPSLTKIIIDECILLCASSGDCDSTKCKDNREEFEKKLTSLSVIITAYKRKLPLIIDNSGEVLKFYRSKYDFMSKDVRDIINRWLNGRGGRLEFYTPKSIREKVAKKCNLKEDKLDPILCGLALASKAPILTLDSDFWCVQQYYPEIKPLCPMEAEDILNESIYQLFKRRLQIRKENLR